MICPLSTLAAHSGPVQLANTQVIPGQQAIASVYITRDREPRKSSSHIWNSAVSAGSVELCWRSWAGKRSQPPSLQTTIVIRQRSSLLACVGSGEQSCNSLLIATTPTMAKAKVMITSNATAQKKVRREPAIPRLSAHRPLSGPSALLGAWT